MTAIRSRDRRGRIALIPLGERFWDKAHKTEGCWNWISSKHRNGYGYICVVRRSRLAHRVAWELTNGPIPAGLLVLHRCDNRRCVRPDHLFLGTQADNLRDMDAKGRRRNADVRGEKNPAAKLTALQAQEVRLRYQPRVMTRSRLAVEYGVSKALIDKILSNDVWADVIEVAKGDGDAR
jgi:hypothetical protein